MLEFDPIVFLAHCAVFLCGVMIFDRLLFGPVYRILELRRTRLNIEGEHAGAARRTLDELTETHRREMEKVHRAGARILRDAKERGERDARSHLDAARAGTLAWCEEEKAKLAAMQAAAGSELDGIYDELSAMVEKKLWGGTRS